MTMYRLNPLSISAFKELKLQSEHVFVYVAADTYADLQRLGLQEAEVGSDLLQVFHAINSDNNHRIIVDETPPFYMDFLEA